MDLRDHTNLVALPADLGPPQHGANGPRMSKKFAGHRRCECGTCRLCLQNARWERIFQEKFADPFYYAPRGLPHDSPSKAR